MVGLFLGFKSRDGLFCFLIDNGGCWQPNSKAQTTS